MVVLGLLVAVCVVLVVAAFIAPRWAERFEQKEDATLRRGERKQSAEGHPVVATALEKSRKVTDASVEAGRKTRARASR